MAISTRWRMPPLSSKGKLRMTRARVLHLHLGQQLLRAAGGLGLAHRLMLADHLDDLLADADRRVQRIHRLLEDHRGEPAAHVAQLRLARPQHVAAQQQDLALAHPHGALGQQADEGHGGDGFARAGFADQPDDLARRHLDADAGQRRYHPAIGRELQREVLDRDDGPGARAFSKRRHLPRSLGSKMSRSPSPSRLNPTAVTRIARPGKVGYHH